MSGHGRETTYALVPVWCDHHPDDTLQKATIDVYDGLKGMGEDLGIDPSTDPNRARLIQHHSTSEGELRPSTRTRSDHGDGLA